MGLAAKLIKTARLEAGLTIAELGQRAGTSKPTISRYENGIVDPGSETLNRLLRACGRELTMTRSYLPRHVDELRARFENAPGPTKDDVTRTVDGRELRTAADVSAFIAELRADGHLTA
ncbi:MAG: helix-turn-helix domain-containing protein [Euzebya sp.]